MANSNLNVRIFPFFDSVRTPLEADATSDGCRNSGYDNLTLEIGGEGTANVTVEGCVNTQNAKNIDLEDSECNWYPLAALSAQDYSKSSAISAKGIYFVGVSGVSRIRVKATSVSGKVQIVGALSK